MVKGKQAPRSRKSGLSPGTLIHLGERKSEKVGITLINFDEDRIEERQPQTIDELLDHPFAQGTTWINIDGLHQVEIIERLGQRFGIHALVLEDIVSTGQRPKVEEFEDHIFIVLRMLVISSGFELEDEQVTLILGRDFVLTFQERSGDVFDPVRLRLRANKGRSRKLGSDYLAYALMDAVVDHYFEVLEKMGDRIEALDEALTSDPSPKVLEEIHDLKRSLIYLRKAVWPLRDVINRFVRGETPLFAPQTLIYLRDVYDHTVQVIDSVETYRDIVSGMMELYLSSVSNRMNEVMKVLTIIATIFIPLTFIVGVYGMNFHYMPELEWRWGYAGVLGIMGLIVLLMVLYFRRKKWF